jgi:hypothetical protein
MATRLEDFSCYETKLSMAHEFTDFYGDKLLSKHPTARETGGPTGGVSPRIFRNRLDLQDT